MIRNILISILLCAGAATHLSAQELEYKMELGGGLGGSFYVGDANSTPFAHPGPMAAALARFNLNPRMAVKANLAMGHISGNTEGKFFPENANEPGGGTLTTVSFSRNVFDLGAQFEYNFWGYGMGGGYKGNRRLTPYIALGIGFTYAPAPVDNVFALNLPMGVGVKYKLKERLNIGFEWSIRFTTTDNLDVSEKDGLQLSDPYGVKSGMFKNKDCYSFTMVYLTYDLFPKYRKCNN